MKSKLKSISLISLGFSVLVAASVNAASFNGLQPVCFAQRYCPDVDFNADTTEVKGIACVWHEKDNDATMSLTTHFNDSRIDHVSVSCQVTPAHQDTPSQLTDIRGAKSASISNVVTNKNTATFDLTYKGTDKNANILFDLNEQLAVTPDRSAPNPNTYTITQVNRYTEGDKISCDFTVHRK